MDDRLFIDHVDNEWFLRAKSLGYDAYGICTAIMEHTLGEDSKTFWLFGERRMILHKPFRYYYMFRNSILLYRRSYIPLKWKYTDFISRIRVLIILLLITNKRIECVKYITQGVIDGLRGKAGAI